ncbi:hypothetical protein [Flavobacterium sp.]|uniref:hypothetical protein n=1 Tax=Flavobacterium sp. TaxID=239 RepID=UPI00404770D2
MNKQFIELNERKVKILLLTLSILFTSLAIVICYINNEFNWIFTLYLGVVFPFILVFIGYLGWVYNYKNRKIIFSKSPLNQLSKIGFYTCLKNQKSIGEFARIIEEIQISDFKINCDIVNSKQILFSTFTDFRKLDSIDYKFLRDKYKSKGIIFDFMSVKKKYELKEIYLLSVEELNEDLKDFVRILEFENFKPIEH